MVSQDIVRVFILYHSSCSIKSQDGTLDFFSVFILTGELFRFKGLLLPRRPGYTIRTVFGWCGAQWRLGETGDCR